MKTGFSVLLLTATALWGQDNVTCTNATLQGDYGFTVTGTRPSAPGSIVIETVVGVAMTHFDGDGNLTQTDNIHGSISGYTAPDRPGTGVYSLNPDCTGTMQLSSPGSPTLTLHIVVVDNGNEVRTAVVNPLPVMVTSNGRRTTQRSIGAFLFGPDIRKNPEQ
ncbi:MAG: hypothetical protein WCB12_15680 [Bryobacteraceae bacterium]